MSDDSFRPGDHWLVDDRTGNRIRASESRTEWNGAVVHEDDFEERHPQDYVRGRVDRQIARQPLRPEPVAVLIGPLTTLLAADHAAGDQTLTVESSVRMAGGDHVRIMLDNGEMFRALVSILPSATTITLATPLPWAASTGQAVVDESAISPANIG